jgi:hypothetical protein
MFPLPAANLLDQQAVTLRVVISPLPVANPLNQQSVHARAGRNKTIMLDPFSMKVLSASYVNSGEIRRSFIPFQDMVRTSGACRILLCGYLTTAAS